MLTPEEQKAENALDNSFKGSIEVIKKALQEEDIDTIREIIGNITVWSGHLGERPKWLTPFSKGLKNLIEKHGYSGDPDAKINFFKELRIVYDNSIINND